MKVDGFCQATDTIYEFNGCIIHGHLEHMEGTTRSPFTGASMRDLAKATDDKLARLRATGKALVVMWECEWTRLKKTDQEVKEYMTRHNPYTAPLEPRDAFFGGRTNAVKLYYEARGDERIKYIDVCSLYPYVNSHRPYPIGHPVIITQDFGDIDQYFGLVKADILPPRDLYHPLLPMRTEDKLLFPLCRTCALTSQTTSCEHSVADRVLKGCWVTEEVKKAVELGYTITKIHEVWHFEETDISTGAPLFTGYINTFLKMKLESSGWPPGVSTEEEKAEYVRDIEQREGLTLDIENIRYNECQRLLAKLMLNSFWGKFGERDNLTETEFVSKPATFFNILRDPRREVSDVTMVHPELVEVRYKTTREFLELKRTTNIFIACFTTCWARLHLYTALESLGRDVLYYDTDSVIYVSRPGSGVVEPEIGRHLGDFTDELDGRHIVRFVSGGPKNYGYELSDGSRNIKVRGITLNYANSQKVNFDVLSGMILDRVTDPVVVTDPSKIVRRREDRTLHSRQQRKRYQIVYNKRCRIDNYDTLPYGHEDL